MRVLVAGPPPINGEGRNVVGVSPFNDELLAALADAGHEVLFGLTPILGMSYAGCGAASAHCGCPVLPEQIWKKRGFLRGIDLLIISTMRTDFAWLLRFARCPVIIWTHGVQCDPLDFGIAEAMRCRDDVLYVAINNDHMKNARRHGLGPQQIAKANMPALVDPSLKLLPAEKHCAGPWHLQERKNPGLCVQIAKAAGFPIWIYGNAPQRWRAKVEDPPQVLVMGNLPHDDFVRRLGRAAFAVFAGIEEGRPMAAIECMARGVACLVPDIPLYREFVSPAFNLFYDFENPAIAAEDIARITAMENRLALSREALELYGRDVFRRDLEGLMGRVCAD